MKKILIAVPCMNQVPAEFADNLARLTAFGCPGYKIGLTTKIGSLIYTSRDSIATEAVETGADYVMWLDSDMMFPPEIIQRMLVHLERDDVDMVSGLYFRRVPPFTPVLFDKLEQLEDGGIHWSNFAEIPGELFEVGGCGFGAVLMTSDVFIAVQNEFNQMFTPMFGAGEDLSFCIRARKLGYRIWCDPTIDLGHVGYNVVTKNFFLAYQAQQEGMKDACDSEKGSENK